MLRSTPLEKPVGLAAGPCAAGRSQVVDCARAQAPHRGGGAPCHSAVPLCGMRWPGPVLAHSPSPRSAHHDREPLCLLRRLPDGSSATDATPPGHRDRVVVVGPTTTRTPTRPPRTPATPTTHRTAHQTRPTRLGNAPPVRTRQVNATVGPVAPIGDHSLASRTPVTSGQSLWVAECDLPHSPLRSELRTSSRTTTQTVRRHRPVRTRRCTPPGQCASHAHRLHSTAPRHVRTGSRTAVRHCAHRSVRTTGHTRAQHCAMAAAYRLHHVASGPPPSRHRCPGAATWVETAERGRNGEAPPIAITAVGGAPMPGSLSAWSQTTSGPSSVPGLWSRSWSARGRAHQELRTPSVAVVGPPWSGSTTTWSDTWLVYQMIRSGAGTSDGPPGSTGGKAGTRRPGHPPAIPGAYGPQGMYKGSGFAGKAMFTYRFRTRNAEPARPHRRMRRERAGPPGRADSAVCLDPHVHGAAAHPAAEDGRPLLAQRTATLGPGVRAAHAADVGAVARGHASGRCRCRTSPHRRRRYGCRRGSCSTRSPTARRRASPRPPTPARWTQTPPCAVAS